MQSDPIGLASLRNDIDDYSKRFIARTVSIGLYSIDNSDLSQYSTYSYVGNEPIWFNDDLGLGRKTKSWYDNKGRKQVVIYCKSRKEAKDLAAANGGIWTKKRKKTKKNRGVRSECHDCGGRHFHDKNHENPKKPNIHYEFE